MLGEEMHSKMKNYSAQMSVMPRLGKPAHSAPITPLPPSHLPAPALNERYRFWRSERTLRTKVFPEASREHTRLELIREESRAGVKDVEAQGMHEN